MERAAFTKKHDCTGTGTQKVPAALSMTDETSVCVCLDLVEKLESHEVAASTFTGMPDVGGVA